MWPQSREDPKGCQALGGQGLRSPTRAGPAMGTPVATQLSPLGPLVVTERDPHTMGNVQLPAHHGAVPPSLLPIFRTFPSPGRTLTSAPFLGPSDASPLTRGRACSRCFRRQNRLHACGPCVHSRLRASGPCAASSPQRNDRSRSRLSNAPSRGGPRLRRCVPAGRSGCFKCGEPRNSQGPPPTQPFPPRDFPGGPRPEPPPHPQHRWPGDHPPSTS